MITRACGASQWAIDAPAMPAPKAFRSLDREEALRNQILTDAHSPSEFRVNGVVRNVDPWYTAFDVKPGHTLYLPPDQRVHIW